MRAYIVIDLGFGDCGKGLLTDFLARKRGAGLVVRYNGGAQAGHNVVTPGGRQHTFSQFGSGTFVPGVKTFLSRYMVFHPTALLVEGDALATKGVPDAFQRLRVSQDALVITPFHQAANRLREIGRADGRHGSCGVGVGEAVEDARAHPAGSLRAGDLLDPPRLRRKLEAVRQRERAQLLATFGSRLHEGAFAHEWQVFERADVTENWIAAVRRIAALGLVAPDDVLRTWLRHSETAVFEGAQGVLLDAEAGFHPYTTWSDCTARNAMAILKEMAPGYSAFQIGVMRCYVMRHGPGPLPTETGELAPLVTEHNRTNPWQGAVRYAWFDALLARYALSLAGKLDSLLITHLDVLPRLTAWKFCNRYHERFDFEEGTVERAPSGEVTDLHPRRDPALESRQRFSRALTAVEPALEACRADETAVIRKIEELTGCTVGMVSRGPSAADVQLLPGLMQ